MIHDSTGRYGWLTRLLHWSMAVLIVLQFGKFADRLNDGHNAISRALGPWHTTIGTVLLVLVAIRIAWALAQLRRRPAHDPATIWLVRAGHGLMYLGMVALPVTGLLVMLGGGYGHEVFGLVLFPEGPEVGWARVFGALHSPLAWLLAALLLGHSAVALYHHFIRRDHTLKRML